MTTTPTSATTAEKAYFVDTDYLYLVQAGKTQWTMDDQKKPVDQDAVVIPMYWMGNMVCTNRSLQASCSNAQRKERKS